MGKIFYITGKTSSGKDTIYKRVLSEINKDKEVLNEIILCTTRPIRTGEQEGREYYFVTNEQKDEMLENNQIAELRTYNTVLGDWHYFTASSKIEEDKNYIGLNTIEGIKKLQEYYGKEKIVPINITLDITTLLERALSREKKQKNFDYKGESTEKKVKEMIRRIAADNIDFDTDKLLEVGIDINTTFENYDLDKVVEQVKKYIISFINLEKENKNKIMLKED